MTVNFNIEKFYDEVNGGKAVETCDILNSMRPFKHIIIWGAGNLGRAVGDKLKEEGIRITEYWDQRFARLMEYNGTPVREAFYSSYPVEDTLVISCIANGSLGDQWPRERLLGKGYTNIIQGMSLFAGIVCPLNEDIPFDISVCTNFAACSLCNCKKYISLRMKETHKRQDNLLFQLMTFIITTRCSLQCKYCGQRLHEYPVSERRDYPLKNIQQDIDAFFNAIDFVGMVSVIGGEPFLHPDLDKIITHILRHDNFGVVNITTNGVCRMDSEILNRIKNPKLKISFSLYTDFLTEAQKSQIQRNIDLVRQVGIAHSTGNPLWVKPTAIEKQSFSREQLIAAKGNCQCNSMAASIRNGQFIPCTIVEVASGTHLLDLSEDCVDIHAVNNLRQSLIQNLEKEYYHACMYCNPIGTEEVAAGEQLHGRHCQEKETTDA